MADLEHAGASSMPLGALDDGPTELKDMWQRPVACPTECPGGEEEAADRRPFVLRKEERGLNLGLAPFRDAEEEAADRRPFVLRKERGFNFGLDLFRDAEDWELEAALSDGSKGNQPYLELLAQSRAGHGRAPPDSASAAARGWPGEEAADGCTFLLRKEERGFDIRVDLFRDAEDWELEAALPDGFKGEWTYLEFLAEADRTLVRASQGVAEGDAGRVEEEAQDGDRHAFCPEHLAMAAAGPA